MTSIFSRYHRAWLDDDFDAAVAPTRSGLDEPRKLPAISAVLFGASSNCVPEYAGEQEVPK